MKKQLKKNRKLVKGSEKKGQGVSEIPKGKKKSSMKRNRSIGNVDGDLPGQELVEDPPQKRVRGADGEIAAAFLLSPEKALSMLRPRKPVPSFQKVLLNESEYEMIVGKRVKVYWSGSRRWFVGRVMSFDKKKKQHKILYDDGDKEELDLKRERFELEVMRGETFNICSKSGPGLEKKVTSSDGDIAAPLLSPPEKVSSKLRPRKPVPSFKKVVLNENELQTIVGKRVRVFWPNSRRWFVGRVMSFDNEKKQHRILYDDGDKEDLDLKEERFELELMRGETFNIYSKSGPFLQKKEMSLDGGEASEAIRNGSSLNLEDGQAKKHARTKNKQTSKAAKKVRFQRHRGKDTGKTEDMARNIEIDVHPEEIEDHVTSDDVNGVYEHKNATVGKRASKLRVGKSSKEEKAEKMSPSRVLDVHPENAEMDEAEHISAEGANGESNEKPFASQPPIDVKTKKSKDLSSVETVKNPVKDGS